MADIQGITRLYHSPQLFGEIQHLYCPCLTKAATNSCKKYVYAKTVRRCVVGPKKKMAAAAAAIRVSQLTLINAQNELVLRYGTILP